MKAYDLVIITNVPAFYKTNLYNSLNEKISLYVIYISGSSEIRNDNFSEGLFKFDYTIINKCDYEKRKKINSLKKIYGILNEIEYKYLLYPGWEIKELFILSFLIPKLKNMVAIESSILETKTTGIHWLLKVIYLSRMSTSFCSGALQSHILNKANFKGKNIVTGGVGVINRKHKRITDEKPSSEHHYLYVGRLSEEKNLEFLVESFNKSGRKLTIVGDGHLRKKLEHIANSNILFVGYVNNDKLNLIYKTHTIFVLPSIAEPWGLVVDEALWYGLPVIISDKVGCADDLVVQYSSGLVFDFDSKDSLEFCCKDMEEYYSCYLANVRGINFQEREFKQVNSYVEHVLNG